VENNRFAEWAHVHGYRYGTPKEYVEKALTEGMVMIFEIDVQGAAQLKAAYPDDAVLVFVVPPSAAETERRLRARKTNTEEDIQIRLKNAREEIRHWEDFDYLVYNDRLEDAIQDVLYIARAEQLETKRFSCDIWPD
ncbi:guanylate kinase, partial [bacterium]